MGLMSRSGDELLALTPAPALPGRMVAVHSRWQLLPSSTNLDDTHRSTAHQHVRYSCQREVWMYKGCRNNHASPRLTSSHVVLQVRLTLQVHSEGVVRLCCRSVLSARRSKRTAVMLLAAAAAAITGTYMTRAMFASCCTCCQLQRGAP